MTTCALWFVMWFPWCAPDMSEPPPLAHDLAGDIRVTSDEPDERLLDETTCAIMLLNHQAKRMSKASWNGPPYGKWSSYAIYETLFLSEMCLVYYTLQQPKNHGIVTSHGAPNF